MSGFKEKIAEAISKHISLDDTYTYELTRVKTAFEVGNMSLEDFEEWSDENVDDLAGAIVDALQLELNDNQKVVLEWLKSETILTREPPILSVNAFSDKNLLGKLPDKVRKAYKPLDCKQEYEVLAAFAQWGLEQEEE